MKRMLAGAVAATLMGSGLMAATGSAAEAAPYPHSVPTDTSASANPKTIRQGQSTRITVSVEAEQGNAVPNRGQIILRVDPPGGGDNNSFRMTEDWTGQPVAFRVRGTKVGNWEFTARYDSNDNSVYIGSKDDGAFTVKKKKR